MLTSCNNDVEPQIPQSNNKAEDVQTRTNSEYETLSFESMNDFMSAVREIASKESSQEKLSWIKEKYPNFVSMQQVYEEALSEAEGLDDSEEKYMDFKEKYNTLYFPLVGEDAGFYIPMSDLDAAYFVNPAGNVTINNEVKDMRDINDYSQLVELGRAYHSYPNSLLSVPSGYEFFKYTANKDKIGQTYESGWRKNENSGKDRIINLKMDRQLKEWSLPSQPFTASRSVLHIEISFRKHTALGWVNYSSETTIVGEFKYGDRTILKVDAKSKGTSSHDHWPEIPVLQNGDVRPIIVTFPTITSTGLVVHYRGFDNTKPYDTITMNGAWCEVAYPSTITPILQ